MKTAKQLKQVAKRVRAKLATSEAVLYWTNLALLAANKGDTCIWLHQRIKAVTYNERQYLIDIGFELDSEELSKYGVCKMSWGE